jgi:predicted small secreted protein
MATVMKFLCPFLVLFALNSCNTAIGVGRDMREGYHWSKNKIQEKRQQRQMQQDHYGAPVY